MVGCTAGPEVASSSQVPQLFMNERGLKQWSNPQAFGRVPADMQAVGRKYCATLDNGGKRYVPTGYHPQARNVDGLTFQDGGFVCSQE